MQFFSLPKVLSISIMRYLSTEDIKKLPFICQKSRSLYNTKDIWIRFILSFSCAKKLTTNDLEILPLQHLQAILFKIVHHPYYFEKHTLIKEDVILISPDFKFIKNYLSENEVEATEDLLIRAYRFSNATLLKYLIEEKNHSVSLKLYDEALKVNDFSSANYLASKLKKEGLTCSDLHKSIYSYNFTLASDMIKKSIKIENILIQSILKKDDATILEFLLKNNLLPIEKAKKIAQYEQSSKCIELLQDSEYASNFSSYN